MAKVIEVPGHGKVEFPDTMSDQDIVSAIQKNLAPQTNGTVTSSIDPDARRKASIDQGFWNGYQKTPIGLAQMGEAIPGVKAVGDFLGKTLLGEKEPPPSMRDFARSREQDYQRERQASGRSGFDVADFAGQALQPINWVAGAATGGGGLAEGAWPLMKQAMYEGAKSGALAGVLQPVVDTGNMAVEKVKQALLGTAVGAATGGILQGAINTGGYLTEQTKHLLDYFSKDGYKNIAMRGEIKNIGHAHVPKLIDAMESAQTRIPARTVPPGYQGPGVPASPITAAEAVAHLSEGSPVQAAQEAILRSPGGASKIGGDMLRNAEAAQRIGKAVVTADTAPLRDPALQRANIAGAEVPRIRQGMAQAERALDRANMQLETVGAQASKAPKVTLPKDPAPDALKTAVELHAPYAPPVLKTQGEKTQDMLVREMADRKARGFFDKSLTSQSVATEARAALEKGGKQLADLEAQGLQPLQAKTILHRINAQLNDPEIMGSSIGQSALTKTRELIKGATDKNGMVDARTLDKLRREGLGEAIDSLYSKDNPPSKKSLAYILKGTQKAIDDVIEGAGGTGYKPYLKEYSRLIDPIARDVDAKRTMYDPVQKTVIGGGEGVGAHDLAHGPPLLNRMYAIAKWIPEQRARAMEPKVDQYLAGLVSDAPSYGAALKDYTVTQPEMRKRAIKAISDQLGAMRAPYVAGMYAGKQEGQ